MERRSVWILSEGGRKSRGSTLESWFSEGAERPGLELEAVWNWKVRSAYFEAAWNRGRGRGYPKSASARGSAVRSGRGRASFWEPGPRPFPRALARIGCSSLTSWGPAPARAPPRAHPRAAAASYSRSATACPLSGCLSPSGEELVVGLLGRGGGQAMLQRLRQPWRPRRAAWRS